LNYVGIEDFFSEIFSCVDISKGKEVPDIYLIAMEHLQEAAEEICVFEDSHVAVKTAKALGMKTVGIYDKYNYGQKEIEELSDIYCRGGIS